MVKKSRLYLWNSIFPILILGIWGFVVFRNYAPGAWLSGWDNLHPEFDFKLNVARSLSAVWQEYQGLGLLGGMAHASDLPRQVILWGLSLFIPAVLLRWIWIFLMLLFGPLGVYFLISNGLNIGSSFLRGPSAASQSASDVFARGTSGLVGAAFYLLNLATVQFFYVSFDSFVSFYGFLPWLLYFSVKFLKEGGRKNLVYLLIISVLATPAFYVQTFFVVFAVLLLVISLEMAIQSGWMGLKRLVVLGAVVFAVNSYWLLPVGYFTWKGAKDLSASHQNSIATPDTRYFNLNRGNFENISTLRGFWFDYRDYQNGTFEPVIDENIWKTTPYLFYAAILGLLAGLFIKKNPLRFSLPILAVIAYLMLSGYYLKLNIPIVNEMFRSVFTKWSVPFALILSLGLANLARIKYLGIVAGVAILSATLFFGRPVFAGRLFYSEIKKEIPSEYFKLFEFFKNQPAEARILRLPIPTFWGWDFHSWGYRGSGFLWYGIAQPILHRSFDVWSPYNEIFYNEASWAVYSGRREALAGVIQKYNVRYLLLDESVINAGGDPKILFIPEIKRMIADLRYREVFRSTTPDGKEGFLTVYEVNGNDGFVSAPIFEYDSLLPQVSGPKDLIISEAFGEDQGFKEAYNCDLKKLGSVQKTQKEGRVIYRAEGGGVACDYFIYPDLDHTKAYILRIKGENREGRSLKIYLQNWKTNRMDLEELLPEGEFNEEFVIYPSATSGEAGPTREESTARGYTLNLETRSFGRIAAENMVEKIEIYAADYVLPPASADLNFQVQICSTCQVDILGVKKYGTAIYKVDIHGSGLLQLGQGYEDGWVGIVKTGQGWLKLEHKLLSGWANGWLVPSNLKPQTSNIYLIFWPQFLEWGGFVILAICLLVLVKPKP